MLINPNTNINNDVATDIATDTSIATGILDNTQNNDMSTDVLIVGAGLAGLSTAMSLPKNLQIIVLAKEGIYDCSSNYAQGGIAAVIDDNDSIANHVNDTLVAGDGLCDKVATTQILSQGSQAIQWLVEHDVPFTTQPASTQSCANLATSSATTTPSTNTISSQTTKQKLDSLHLTREGGHGCRRVVHADDATGRHIMHTLYQQVADSSNITILPYHEALSLMVEPCQATVKQTQTEHSQIEQQACEKICTGAKVFNRQTNSLFTIHSKAVVLASGGLGQLFSRATAPSICVGDGIMMAWEAGCRLANLEFIQFHPTGLAYKDSNFLISEAVRGEGGRLLCPITKQRFMPNYDERAELAPRDIVARAIANEISNNGLGYVYLDISHQPAEFIKQHFPDIYNHCLNLGIDITTSPIPVAPTAHYTCGGVMTNAQGQTDVAGLYAAGEVTHTGLHGANRLASNSLLECVVVGRAIASHLPSYLTALHNHSLDWEAPTVHVGKDNVTASFALSFADSFKVDVEASFEVSHNHDSEGKTASLDNKHTLDLIDTTTDSRAKLTQLKQLMTTHMGIKRSHITLCDALKQVNAAKTHTPKSAQALTPCSDELAIAEFRWQRLLNLAGLMLQSAIAREESRGGHYRDDFPSHKKHGAISIVEPYQNKSKATKGVTESFNVNSSNAEVA